MTKNTAVLSLGGSLIAPDSVDTDYLRKVRTFLAGRVKKGERFILVVGGGAVARNYISALGQTGRVSALNKDWMGIAATRLNAELLRLSLGGMVKSPVVTNPTSINKLSGKIMVAGGWKPGWSTDYVAVRIADRLKVPLVINLSNIDYVYNRNPKQDPRARPIKRASWREMQKIVGTKWQPGANVPFDPLATKFAASANQSVIVANGKDLANVAKILDGRSFRGTLISG